MDDAGIDTRSRSRAAADGGQGVRRNDFGVIRRANRWGEAAEGPA